jgi:hypothetical protein
MSGLVASVAGFAMAAVTGSRRIHRSNSLEETSSQSIRDFDSRLTYRTL